MRQTAETPRRMYSHYRWLPPKSRAWLTACSAAAVALVAAYGVAAFTSTVVPGRGAGMIFGILAAVLLGVCMALSLRKRFKHRPLGQTMAWLQLHMYGGVLFLLLMLLHAGFGFPSGFQTWSIFLLSLLVGVGGLVGAWLQKWVPHTLSRGLQVEAIYERIPELIQKLREEAEATVRGSSQALHDFHRSELAPALAGPHPSLSFLLDISGGRQHQMMVFAHVARRLSAPEKEKLDDLKQILLEKNDLDAQLSLQRILRAWLYLHVPASAALLALVLVHIGAALYY